MVNLPLRSRLTIGKSNRAMDDLFHRRPSTWAWRPIHYLGSKLRVIDSISDLLNQVETRNGRLCDLFAGSGTVAAAMAPERAVTAIDIQEYSRVLCSALLRPAVVLKEEVEQFSRCPQSDTFIEKLRWAAEALIEYENRALLDARHGEFDPIFDLIELGPIVNYGQRRKRLDPQLDRAVRQIQRRLQTLGLSSGSETVVLRHFGGVYFSYVQAIELAALLETAAKSRKQTQDTVMAALLSTASEIVNTVGKQFAQPIKPRDAMGKPKVHLLPKIIRDRNISVFPAFLRWLDRYAHVPFTGNSHQIFRANYLEALTHHCSDVKVVYADPPYTRDHYSRYYHVLETICLRDDPSIAATHPSNIEKIGKGVYRIDRHQSPFCIKSQAPLAFEGMFSKIRELHVPMVLSYSPLPNSSKPRPRVMAIDDIAALALRFFKNVERVTVDRMSHNKLNNARLNSEISSNAEVFLVCN